MTRRWWIVGGCLSFITAVTIAYLAVENGGEIQLYASAEAVLVMFGCWFVMRLIEWVHVRFFRDRR